MRSFCTLSLVLLLALLASSQDQCQTGKPDDKTTHQNSDSSQKPTPQVQSGAPHGTEESGNKQCNANDQPHPFLTHGEWVMSILTLIYVLLTGFYAYVSHKTLGEIEGQAEHARSESTARDKQFAEQLKVSQDAARAALLNATALQSAERAHIDVEFVRADKTLYYINAVNLGKTRATVLVYSFDRYSFIPKPNHQMPETLTIENGVSHVAERRAVNQSLAVGPPATTFHQVDIAHYLREEQLSGKEIALFGASITYQDIFGGKYQTEAVYSYQVATSMLVNQPRYNRYDEPCHGN
jgi:hypothetical protein